MRVISIAPETVNATLAARLRSLALGETDPDTLAAADRVRARLKARREAQGEQHRYAGRRAPGGAAAARPAVSATELARKHNGDPWALAAAVGATVHWGDGARMRAKGIDGSSIQNPLNAEGPHLVVLADDLADDGDRDLVLLHEIGHIVLGGDASEDECDEFALEFMLAAQMRR